MDVHNDMLVLWEPEFKIGLKRDEPKLAGFTDEQKALAMHFDRVKKGLLELHRQMGGTSTPRTLNIQKYEYIGHEMQENIRRDLFVKLWRGKPLLEERFNFLTPILYSYGPQNDRNARIERYFQAVLVKFPVHSDGRIDFILQYTRYISQAPPPPGLTELQIEANKHAFIYGVFQKVTPPVSIVLLHAINCKRINCGYSFFLFFWTQAVGKMRIVPGSTELQIEANKHLFIREVFEKTTSPVSIVLLHAVNCKLINCGY